MNSFRKRHNIAKLREIPKRSIKRKLIKYENPKHSGDLILKFSNSLRGFLDLLFSSLGLWPLSSSECKHEEILCILSRLLR